MPLDDAPVIGQEHAWWAERDELERVFVVSSSEPPESPDPLSEFWSPESLFTYDHRYADDVGEDDAFADPYAMLGLPLYASWEAVTSAHRRLAKQFHPDMMVGAPDEERSAADERMREINRAYNQIRRARTSTVS